jgi:hypothetical protein
VIRVALLGQPFWCRRLVELFRKRGEDLSPVFVPLGLPSLLKAARSADVFMRVGYRPGGATWRARAFDAAWAGLRALNPKALGVHYWIGTDVLNTLEDQRAGRLRPGPMARAKGDLHWADAPWLVDELATVGLSARSIPLPVPLKDVTPPERLPAPFTALTYIPDPRWEFYDGPSILEAATRLPQVRFEVIGGTGTRVERPLPNLSFHGWQEDVRPFLARAAVAIRLVRHDGMGWE